MLKHVMEQQEALVGLKIWDYLTEEEINSLYNATTDEAIDRLARTYRDKYWNIMLEDYENNGFDIEDNEDVLDSSLSNGTKNALMRAHIYDKEMFLNFIDRKGWDVIARFGRKGAMETFHWIFQDEDEETIKKYIRKYRFVKREETI